MTLYEIIHTAIDPALSILPRHMDSQQARVMLLSIGLQESRFQYRRQMNNGPAASFWQFEKGGGVRGCINHPSSAPHVRNLCMARGVNVSADAIWRAMLTDDVLGAGMARLLLWTDQDKLPALGDVDGAWGYYVRNWRPGKPHPETWAKFHAQALEAVQ